MSTTNPFTIKRLDWILNPKQADLDGETLPTKEEFMVLWGRMNKEQKRFTNACLKAETLAEVIEQVPGLTFTRMYQILDRSAKVMKAIIIGRTLAMSSDVARATYLETLMNNERSRQFHRGHIDRLVTTDREHLQELSKKLSITGDGKRSLLKELIAYGMQTKEHESARICEATGQVIKPAVYTLADPRIALVSLQELNKMDHEYAEIATSTSSVESQAERIKRLREQPVNGHLINRVNKAAQKQAAALDGEALQVTVKDTQPLESEL